MFSLDNVVALWLGRNVFSFFHYIVYDISRITYIRDITYKRWLIYVSYTSCGIIVPHIDGVPYYHTYTALSERLSLAICSKNKKLYAIEYQLSHIFILISSGKPLFIWFFVIVVL